MTPSQIPASAYPNACFSGVRPITPDRVRVSSNGSIVLWIGDMSFGVDRNDDDTRLKAALDIARRSSHACEQFGAIIRGILEDRERERQAEKAAAVRAVEHPHPYEQQAAASAAQALQALEAAGTSDTAGTGPVDG